MGHYLGVRALENGWLRRILGATRIDRAQALAQRHPVGVVFIARFAVGLRVPLYFAAGASGLKWRHMALVDLAGLAITVPLLVGLGWAFGQVATDTYHAAMAHQPIALAAVAAIIAAVMLLRRRTTVQS
jgi:membrane protein DedA with SNARE-associated domain